MIARLPDRMTDGLVPTGRPLSELVPVFLRQFRIVRRRAENTVRGYGADLRVFLGFCDQAQLVYPEQVARTRGTR